jgi:hypothetical protein
MPPKPPAPDEWDQLVVKMGLLTLAAGLLEMVIIQMVCRILGQTEKEIGIRSNKLWCEKFIEVAPASWSNDEREDLAKRLKKIRKLYLRRNRMIHAALGIAGDGSIHGVPKDSSADPRHWIHQAERQHLDHRNRRQALASP